MSTELLIAIVLGYLVMLEGMLAWLVVTIREETQPVHARPRR